eukprot:s1796_g18.t1
MPCRVGVVGAGPLVGRAHCLLLKRLAADDDVELACICQRRADDTALAEQLQVPLYVDAKEMARQEALDGVVIAAPTHLHLALTQACIEGTKLRRVEGRGGTLKALLIEKPICHDLQSAAELLSVTDSAGVVVVTDQDFGPLRGVNMEFSLLKPDSYFCKDDPALEWRRRKGVGGPILINTIHDLDLMRFITGHEITKVFAMTSSAARGEEVEDSGGITVTFDHGAVGTLFFTDAAPAPWSYEFTTGENKKYPPVPGNDMRDCYHFMGAQRSLGFPSLHSFSYRGAAERGWDAPLTVEQPVVQMEDPLLLQMNHFVRVCRGEEVPVCSGRDAVESLAVVLAVQRSAECGRSVAPSELLAEVNKDAVSACRLDSSLLPISKEPAACSAETTTARAGRKLLETVTGSDLASPQSA